MASSFLALEEIIQSIRESDDEFDVIAALKQARPILGADSAVFVSFIRADVSTESYRFLIACNPAFCATYRRSSWFCNDPAIAYAGQNSEPRLLSDLPFITTAQAGIHAADNGFASGAVFPAPSPGRMSRMGVLILGSSSAERFTQRTFSEVRSLGRILSMELLEWAIKQVRQELIRTARLSEEDIRLLRFESQGLKSKDISRVLAEAVPPVHVTSQSIDTKFARMLMRIGTSSRKEASQMAAEVGLF